MQSIQSVRRAEAGDPSHDQQRAGGAHTSPDPDYQLGQFGPAELLHLRQRGEQNRMVSQRTGAVC